jgi:hypothetical protein
MLQAYMYSKDDLILRFVTWAFRNPGGTLSSEDVKQFFFDCMNECALTSPEKDTVRDCLFRLFNAFNSGTLA